MKKFLGSLLFLAALFGVLAFRTARFTSRQPPAERPVRLAVDAGLVAAHLAGAVQRPTVSYEEPGRTDGAAFLSLHQYLADTYPHVATTLTREVVNGRSLLYTWPGREPALEPVVLMAHLDVVPVVPGTEHRWPHPPFAGEVADGYVWGRGALDDKSSVITELEAIERLLAEGYQPRRTVYLAFGHDEELGGTEGAARIAAALRGRGVTRYALVVDEGGAVVHDAIPGLAGDVATIGIAEKGYLNLRLRVTSEGGHSSAPPAETSVGILSKALAKLEARPFPARIDGPTLAMLEYLGPEMPYFLKLALANRWLFSPLIIRQLVKVPQAAALLRTTTAPTILSAGVKANILAPEATAIVNFRIRPGESSASVTDFVRVTIGDPRVSIAPTERASEPSRVSDVNSPAFRTLARTIRQVVPGRPNIGPMLVTGGTDAKYYGARSPNVFRFAPLTITLQDLVRVHGTGERVSVESLATCVRFYYQLIKNLDGQ